jgi:hypothetical protein
MQVCLLRVGIDTGCGGMLGPLFRDGTFEYVPIPDEKQDGRKYGEIMGKNMKEPKQGTCRTLTCLRREALLDDKRCWCVSSPLSKIIGEN